MVPSDGERYEVTIHVNGHALRVPRGQRLTTALWRAGRRVLGRSMRYHRARGLFCGTGECTHCFLRVDGLPNVRACQTRCHEGLWAEDQNAWPSARHDVLAAADLAFPDYLDAHTSFIRPRILKPLYDKVIRGMAGFGKIPKKPVAQRYDARSIEADVLVVGAGPAGLAAAEAAAEAGRDVVLVERTGRFGGRLAWTSDPDGDRDDTAGWVAERRAGLEAADAEVHTNARLIGIYADQGAVAATPTALLRIDAARLVLATGARDAYLPFPGSDRTGVLLATAAHRMLSEEDTLPGRRPVVLGTTPGAVALARDLRKAGADVEALWEPAARGHADGVRRAADLGLAVRPDHRPERAWGRTAFRRIRFRTLRGVTEARGDVLIMAHGRVARAELGQQAGCRLAWRDGFAFTIDADEDGATDQDGVFAAGGVAGTDGWRAGAEQGARAGRRAAE